MNIWLCSTQKIKKKKHIFKMSILLLVIKHHLGFENKRYFFRTMKLQKKIKNTFIPTNFHLCSR